MGRCCQKVGSQMKNETKQNPSLFPEKNYYISLDFYICPLLSMLLTLYHVCVRSVIQSDSVNPRTVACQAPGPWEFPRQKYWRVTISSSKGSSWPRNRTYVSCIGRQILYHWATREALEILNFGTGGPSFSFCTRYPHKLCSHSQQDQYDIDIYPVGPRFQ